MFNPRYRGIDTWFTIRETLFRMMESPIYPVLVYPAEVNKNLIISRLSNRRPSLENTEHALFVLGYTRDEFLFIPEEFQEHFLVYPYYSREVLENLKFFLDNFELKALLSLGTKEINDRLKTYLQKAFDIKLSVGTFEESQHVLKSIA